MLESGVRAQTQTEIPKPFIGIAFTPPLGQGTIDLCPGQSIPLKQANPALRSSKQPLDNVFRVLSLAKSFSGQFCISPGSREPNRSGVQLNSHQVTKVVSVNAEHLVDRPQHGCVTLNSDRPAIIGMPYRNSYW